MQIIQEQVILVLDKIKAGRRWPCRLLFYNVTHYQGQLILSSFLHLHTHAVSQNPPPYLSSDSLHVKSLSVT